MGILHTILIFKASAGMLLSAANITLCASQATCEPRMVVSLTVESGQLAGSESVNFSSLSATDASNNTYTLENPLSLQISKSHPANVYQLRYMQSFAPSLGEKTVSTAYPFCSEGLVNSNGQLKLDSTCGYARQNGQPIPLSGGFCCSCTALAFFTGLSASSGRGSCSALSTRQTAFCLEPYGDSWSAYEVISSRIDYSLELSLSGTDRNGAQLSKKLTLSPAQRISTLEGILATLVGELSPSSESAALSGLVLLGPPSKGEWLALGRDAFSFDGSVCDRIGTSYAAFQNQPRRCEVAAGSCLRNQISDLLSRDAKAVASGSTPSFLLSRFGNFTQSGGGLRSLYSQISTSIVTIELPASHFTFRTNSGNGRILSATVTPFEAQTSTGEVMTSILSNSSFVADFQLAVECRNATVADPTVWLSLPPLSNITKVFSLFAESTAMTLFGCQVSLANRRGQVVDSVHVTGRISARVNITVWPQNPGSTTLPPTKLAAAVLASTSAVCLLVCPQSISLTCLLLAGCGQLLPIGLYLVAFVGAAAVVALIVCICRRR